ncbi:hypothetical protein AB0B54_35920 [Microbispora bryophytorum]|uniref:hypothetical protein n=1 Tax=Microbispora bryophytorum TaxID=1460882 RepID=UPI0033FE272F
MRIHTVVSVVFAGWLALASQPALAAPLSMERSLRVAAEIVEYECTTDGDKQDVKVNVELTLPDNATAGQQMSIGWSGTYVTGSELRAPAAGLTGAKLYAYAALTGIEDLTSATGVSEPLNVTAGQTIPLPETTVSMKTTSSNAGTAMVRPAAINIGPSPTAPVIECEVRSPAALTTYTLTVAQSTGHTNTSPTPDGSTPSPKPTRTVTTTVTAAAADEDDLDQEFTADDQEFTAEQGVDATPVGGASTGGGGEAGTDGRMYVLTGLVITLAACAGLLLRRRPRSG